MILNGHRTSHGPFDSRDDGLLESGRPLNVKGAHCRGFNSRSVGICLIGRNEFSEQQMKTLFRSLGDLFRHYNLDPDAVYGHYELDDHKTCPNLDMDVVRQQLRERYS